MLKKFGVLIIVSVFIISLLANSVSGDTNRFSNGFIEDARPGVLMNSELDYAEGELCGTWVMESTLGKLKEMKKSEIDSVNTLHLLKNGEVVGKYNNGPVVKKYAVKNGKLAIFSYLRSEYKKGEAETSVIYYSIVSNNGTYKIVSGNGNVYVKISANENAELSSIC